MKKRKALQIMRAVYHNGPMLDWGNHLIAKMERYRYQKHIVMIGDFYEGCDFVPRKATKVEINKYFSTVYGKSLINPNEESNNGLGRSCSLDGCGVIRLTKEMVDERIEAFKKGGLDYMIDNVCNKNDRWKMGK